MNSERYHLTLSLDGKPARHGWWGSERTARLKCAEWIGEPGNAGHVRVTLVDEVTGAVLTTWSDEALSLRHAVGMDHQETPAPGEDDELEGIVGEAPPVDEYRLSTRAPQPDVSGTS